MTKKNNFNDAEGRITLHKIKIEDYCTYIDEYLIEQIFLSTREDKNIIARILAYIEYARKSINVQGYERVCGFNSEAIISTFSELINHYTIEMILEVVQGLKWYEINSIIYSRRPIRALEEII